MDDTVTLSAEHHHELQWDSCIAPSIITERGYQTLTGTGADRDLLESLGFKPYVWNRDDAYPGLLIPMRGMDGSVRGHQYKPAVPRARIKADQSHGLIKYETPTGAPNVVDVPAATAERLRENPTRPLWITEGVKKVDSLVSVGMACVGLTGVFNWKSKEGVLGDWEEVPIKGRPAVVCFDADAAGNRNVQLAMSRLGAWLRARGATTVHYIVVPATVGEIEVKGVDDFFAAGGTLEVLTAVATTTPPGAGVKDASFTDAFLVEELADAMAGRYCWASGLGWLRWNGRIWKDVSDVEPLEAVRIWASGEFDRTLAAQSENKATDMASKIAGWRAILNKGRLVALRDLAKGLLQRDSAEFDGDPDLLTVGNGTVHLPTGKLLPFSPEHCITKMCDAEYHPDATHPSWTAALRAVPEDMHLWFQDRLGQATTGYMTPDHMMVIAHGGGSNGKSTIMEIVRKTMADYGVLVSDRVLMASPDAHPTELMDFRGARYALMEETPEARQLNTHRLKQTVGTPTIKARRIRMDPVEFIASHSLFINTNYRPTVTETDHGTWRRLSLMPWPFTFKKPGQPLTGPYDRPGDPALAYAAGSPAVRDAALAWMVAGARAWYERGRMMLPVPERVERETREWRAETDLILGFSDECLTFEKEAFTQTQDMLKAFNDWSGERGHRPWNDRTFASRFGAHDMVRAAKVQQGRVSLNGKQQRGWTGVGINKEGMDPFSGMRDEPEPPAPDVLDELTAAGQELQAESTSRCPNCQGQGCAYCDLDRPMPEETLHKVQGTDPVKARFIEPEPPAGRGEWEITSESRPEDFPNAGEWTEVREGDEVIGYSQPVSPVALGFDLETPDWWRLFVGGHEGPFVRLGGTTDGTDHVPLTTEPTVLLEELKRADVIYGHNILGFDLLALAHHHGADYDKLAAKSVDTLVLARLVDPPMSKGMPNGYYGLDQVAQRLGHEGKTDDLKGLAKRYGGFDKIPVDSREYQDYLRGDLAATKAVNDALVATLADQPEAQQLYACREMEIVALQNRMTLNGWAVDTELLAERVAHEDAQRAEAVRILAEEYGMPVCRPDRFKLRKRADWPEGTESLTVTEARESMRANPEKAVSFGIAVRIPGAPYDSPWSADPGRDAIEAAFVAAGARHLPRTKSGGLALSSDALGDKPWFNPDTNRSQPGLMQVYAGNEKLGRVVELVLQATGARRKYGEMAEWVVNGRVHAFIGDAQGSGRWAHVKPGISTMGKRGAGAAERDIMVADPGHILITADLSQVDLRAMAGLSQDPAYMAIMAPGRNAHREMSLVYFGEATDETYGKTKAFNHAGNYGQGPKAVSERTGIPLDKCYDIQRAKAETYPRLAEYIQEVRDEAASGRLLDNGFGRLMRPNPERAYTQGPALMGQGASRDIMTESLLRLVKYAEDNEQNVRPYLRAVVHDEVVLSVPEAEAELWARILQEAFTWEWRGVPILCEVSEPAYRWSECK